ncbi:MAG: DUF3471 domain-containing protein [Flavisolibacter sp.]|nr:DUF3471 domain-containing protein [Flavisolibacter sp.]
MLHQSGVQTMGTRIEDNAVQKTLELSTALLKQYVGTYELAPGFYIDITLDGKVLKGQATGQDAFELFAEKDNLFYLKVVEAKVEFIKDEKGVVNELILYQGGREMKGFKTK